MSRHEWVNSTLGHGANMCRHCLMTDAEAAALGCLDTCDAARTPTDAEIEAMAEKLLQKWVEMMPPTIGPPWDKTWGELTASQTLLSRDVVARFRAMARVALEGRG